MIYSLTQFTLQSLLFSCLTLQRYGLETLSVLKIDSNAVFGCRTKIYPYLKPYKDLNKQHNHYVLLSAKDGNLQS